MKIDIHSTNHKYRVIYADPAWQFKSKKSGGSMKSGAAQVYSVTSIEDMKALPVARLADDNCMLVMWWVGSMPQEAIEKLCGDVPRIELFARSAAPGWDCWGNEAPSLPEQSAA